MTHWKVDPAAVRGVLAAAEEDRSGYEEVLRAVAEATGAGVAAGVGPSTAAALHAIATDPFGLDVDAAKEQVGTAIDATREALDAYEQGDAAMAGETTAASRVVPR